MLKSDQERKSVALVMAILAVSVTAVAILQAVAIRKCSVGRAPAPVVSVKRGIEVPGFTVTAYCPGRCCNGSWAGRTATGKSIDYYTARKINIAAVDPAVIPLGTLFAYGGKEYLAVDIGGKIRGKRIDLMMPNHRDTCSFGVKKDQSIRIIAGRRPAASRSGTGPSRIVRIEKWPLYSPPQ